MKTNCALAFLIVGILASGQAIADKPSSAGSDRKSEKWGQPEHTQGRQRDGRERRDDDKRTARHSSGPELRIHEYFGDHHRTVVRDYYIEDIRRGHCPPGLAKKQNGCMPPGLAKKWTVGQQLPRNVIFHNLPPALATQLGQLPAGYRYAQVADHILLIASRTGMIIDAISILGSR